MLRRPAAHWTTGILCLIVIVAAVHPTTAQDRPRRVLLIGQGPDGHPVATHEYMAGCHLIQRILSRIEGVQPLVVRGDGDWAEGPDLIDSADGVFLFLSEGAKWVHEDPTRRKAFQDLARRGGGMGCWHWAMGCRDAAPVQTFVDLFGGCHGGPDRRYKVVEVPVTPGPAHPVLQGIKPFEVREEFYYRLKFGQPPKRVRPLLQAPVEGEKHTVCWAWERPGGGRSFGFSGGHFHKNWQNETYRRLATQGILWTLSVPIPADGVNVDVPAAALRLPAK